MNENSKPSRTETWKVIQFDKNGYWNAFPAAEIKELLEYGVVKGAVKVRYTGDVSESRVPGTAIKKRIGIAFAILKAHVAGKKSITWKY